MVHDRDDAGLGGLGLVQDHPRSADPAPREAVELPHEQNVGAAASDVVEGTVELRRCHPLVAAHVLLAVGAHDPPAMFVAVAFARLDLALDAVVLVGGVFVGAEMAEAGVDGRPSWYLAVGSVHGAL